MKHEEVYFLYSCNDGGFYIYGGLLESICEI